MDKDRTRVIHCIIYDTVFIEVFSSLNAEGKVIHCYEDEPVELDRVQYFVMLVDKFLSFFTFFLGQTRFSSTRCFSI